MPSQSCSTFDELYALSPFDCALLAVDCGVDNGVCGPGFTRRRLEALGDEALDRSNTAGVCLSPPPLLSFVGR